MRRFFLICCIGISSLVSSLSLHAAVDAVTTSLTMKSVNVIDSKKIRVSFSDSIDVTSVVLKISKQSDNSSVSVASVDPVTGTPESVDIILPDDLEEGSSYTLTVQAAIGTSGSTIIDGAGALREFVTPSPLKKSTPVLSAPPNPNAVQVEDPKPVVAQDTGTETPVKEIPPKEAPVPTEELPLTGMNSFFLLLFILPIAYIILRKKSL